MVRVMIVEDDHATRRRFADAISSDARTTLTQVVRTGREAIAQLPAARPDVLLVDLGLPDKDGLVWLGDQRRRQMTRPVLVLTARDSLEDLVAGLNQGADDYLRKPFELDELIARVRATVAVRAGAAPETLAAALRLRSGLACVALGGPFLSLKCSHDGL